MKGVASFARLVRLPNVFTACADISIGILAGRPTLSTAALLLAASSFLYACGMVWNDYFDRNIDRIERPKRPIPSGAISSRLALVVAILLGAAGISAAAAVGTRAFGVAVGLQCAILAYDAGLKSTIIGPLMMGVCRGLNVLLGFSIVDHSTVDVTSQLVIAGIVGLYIVGVTIFARNEAGLSRVNQLRSGFAVCTIAVLSAAAFPGRSLSVHPLVCIGLLLFIGRFMFNAIEKPDSEHVQTAVKNAIVGLILLDAALAVAAAGPFGLGIIIWIIPAIALSRHLKMT